MIETKSARVAIAQATANGMRVPAWCEEQLDTGGSRGNSATVWHGLDCGRVLAAVDRNPEHIRCWLLLAYGADGYAPSRAVHVVTSELYARYARERTIRTSPARIANAAGAVVSDLCQCYRCPSRPGATPARYADAIGIRRDQWRDVRRMVEGMRGIVDEWDAQGLGVVADELPALVRDVA